MRSERFDAPQFVAIGLCSAKQTGLSREEILARLSKSLPDAVDKYTPEGRIPAASEAA